MSYEQRVGRGRDVGQVGPLLSRRNFWKVVVWRWIRKII
jgi:hypothetical protein